MNLDNEVMGEFLDLVGKSSLSKYLATHGAPGKEGLERGLRWAAWNFRKGERSREACFLMSYQNELRAMLEVGEQAYLDEADIHRGLHQDPTLAEPDVRIEFDEEDEDVEDAYSFGSAAGFSFRPPNMREEPLPERDGFLDAARLLVENAAMQDSGLSSSLESLNIDDDVAEDSKDLLTFGTVAVDAPNSPGWVPPPTDEPSVMSTRAPVFLDAAEPVLRSPQAEPVFEAREVVTDLPPPEREHAPASNAPEPDDEVLAPEGLAIQPEVAEVPADEEPTRVENTAAVLAALEQNTTTAAIAPQSRKLPMALGIAGIAVLVAAVSVAVTLTTLQVTATDPATPAGVARTAEPDGIADAAPTQDAPVVQPVEDAVADPELVEPAVADVDGLEPELLDEQPEPEVAQPEPEVAQPEPEVAQPEPEPEPEVAQPEPEVAQPEPEVAQPEPAAVAPAVVQPEPEVAEPEPAPAPAAPSMVGSWQGSGGAGPMQLVIDSQNGRTISGRILMQNEDPRTVAGQLDPATGVITLSEIGGSASFSGELRNPTQASGTWRAAPGTTARQWFVVKQ